MTEGGDRGMLQSIPKELSADFDTNKLGATIILIDHRSSIMSE